jgi:hypothetical protein
MEILLEHLENNEDIINTKLNSNIKLYQELVVLKFEIHGKSGR